MKSIIRSIHGVFDKNPGIPFQIVFFGGEPLLEFESILAIANSVSQKRKETSFSLNTNGTLIDDAAAGCLADKGICVSIALDGCAGDHDRNRVSHDGRGSHTKAMKGLECLLRAGVRLSVRMTVTPDNVMNLKNNIIFLKKSGLDVVGFAPDWNAGWSEYSIDLWSDQILELSKSYFKGKNELPKIQDFEKISRNETAKCLPGRETLCINPDGSILPCHRSSSEDKAGLILMKHPECASCGVRAHCTKCIPKYGESRPSRGCQLKKCLISAVKIMQNGDERERKAGGGSMNRLVVIKGEAYSIPEEVLEKYRVNREGNKVTMQSTESVSKRTEPPLKGNWYELGESDCY
jgi:sulfatase maturation enzyme AslB (radical SAM superfamily)